MAVERETADTHQNSSKVRSEPKVAELKSCASLVAQVHYLSSFNRCFVTQTEKRPVGFDEAKPKGVLTGLSLQKRHA